MQDDLLVLATMALVQGKHYLSENAPDKVLLDMLAFFATLSILLNQLGQVTTFAVLHH